MNLPPVSTIVVVAAFLSLSNACGSGSRYGHHYRYENGILRDHIRSLEKALEEKGLHNFMVCYTII